MKRKTQIKSKLSVAFSTNFPEAYKKFTLKHVNERQGSPETVLAKPLTECKIALITTAGVHLKTDRPFDVDNPAGDPTYRLIPAAAQEEELTVTHIYYNTKFAKTDPTIVFPLPQLRELKDKGSIHSLADVNIGLNGGILDTSNVEQEAIPQVMALFENEQVDIALLVPG
ncbi:D-proline reductase subunit gamma [Planococcus massiliensis]|uniref:D-proline reductase subunit gamma n=1 Tax=Planococcus massiliensis TaxID=1499687 RepID=A0A098EQL0_9BACL|nr:glycine/sarcosine/betaine reductase selenoprotein B family protein [Planococcus massiliensis]CEG24092.1 D-proline reductase subunit gamma [Planococcus massiliensis]